MKSMSLFLRLAALALALLLPLAILAEGDQQSVPVAPTPTVSPLTKEDHHRWVEDVTKLLSIPTADTTRLDTDFTRLPAPDSASAASAVLAWLGTDALHDTAVSDNGDLSIFLAPAAIDYFLTPAEVGWTATVCTAQKTLMLEIDRQGRLLYYGNVLQENAPLWEGALPEGLAESVLSYIRHFAGLNGCSTVTDFALGECRAANDAYDLRVDATASLDGVPCSFTISLETMGFTAIECPLAAQPFLLTATPAPEQAERITLSLPSGSLTVFHQRKPHYYASFTTPPADALPRDQVLTIALQALMAQEGLTAAELTDCIVECGYSAEGTPYHWQLDFTLASAPDSGAQYTVHVRDSDGAVLGVWGPDEANG